MRSGLQTRQGRSIDPRGGAGSSVRDDNVTVDTTNIGRHGDQSRFQRTWTEYALPLLYLRPTFHRKFKILKPQKQCAKRMQERIKYLVTLYRFRKLFCFYKNDWMKEIAHEGDA